MYPRQRQQQVEFEQILQLLCFKIHDATGDYIFYIDFFRFKENFFFLFVSFIIVLLQVSPLYCTRYRPVDRAIDQQ